MATRRRNAGIDTVPVGVSVDPGAIPDREGLWRREALIPLAQTVFDPHKQPPLDGVEADETGANRMLGSCIAAEAGGNSNTVAHKHTMVAIDLSTESQHNGIASLRGTALCAEAGASVVIIIAIFSLIRDS